MRHVPQSESRNDTASTFAERLAYARWIRHLSSGAAATNAEIGRAVKRTGQAITGWSVREAPPPDYLNNKPLHSPLAAFLGVDERWLISGEGDPPEPELWKQWRALRTQPLRQVAKGVRSQEKKRRRG